MSITGNENSSVKKKKKKVKVFQNKLTQNETNKKKN